MVLLDSKFMPINKLYEIEVLKKHTVKGLAGSWLKANSNMSFLGLSNRVMCILEAKGAVKLQMSKL